MPDCFQVKWEERAPSFSGGFLRKSRQLAFCCDWLPLVTGGWKDRVGLLSHRRHCSLSGSRRGCRARAGTYSLVLRPFQDVIWLCSGSLPSGCLQRLACKGPEWKLRGQRGAGGTFAQIGDPGNEALAPAEGLLLPYPRGSQETPPEGLEDLQIFCSEIWFSSRLLSLCLVTHFPTVWASWERCLM